MEGPKSGAVEKAVRVHLISSRSTLDEILQEVTNVVEDSQLDDGAVVSCVISCTSVGKMGEKTKNDWKRTVVPGMTGKIALGDTKVVWVKYSCTKHIPRKLLTKLKKKKLAQIFGAFGLVFQDHLVVLSDGSGEIRFDVAGLLTTQQLGELIEAVSAELELVPDVLKDVTLLACGQQVSPVVAKERLLPLLTAMTGRRRLFAVVQGGTLAMAPELHEIAPGVTLRHAIGTSQSASLGQALSEDVIGPSSPSSVVFSRAATIMSSWNTRLEDTARRRADAFQERFAVSTREGYPAEVCSSLFEKFQAAQRSYRHVRWNGVWEVVVLPEHEGLVALPLQFQIVAPERRQYLGKAGLQHEAWVTKCCEDMEQSIASAHDATAGTDPLCCVMIGGTDDGAALSDVKVSDAVANIVSKMAIELEVTAGVYASEDAKSWVVRREHSEAEDVAVAAQLFAVACKEAGKDALPVQVQYLIGCLVASLDYTDAATLVSRFREQLRLALGVE
jgi:hypothetical protein